MSHSKKDWKCALSILQYSRLEICEILLKVTLRAIECLCNKIHNAYNDKYSNKYINIQIIILKNVY